jgi:hypothetical protein
VALWKARISAQPLWGFSSSNPYHSQSRAEQIGICIQLALENNCHFKPKDLNFTRNIIKQIAQESSHNFKKITLFLLSLESWSPSHSLTESYSCGWQ